MKNTNTLHYGLSCAFGAFVSGSIALQFGHTLLWTLVGATVGIIVGLIAAMITHNPKGFWAAIKHASAKAWKEITVADHSRVFQYLRAVFWMTMLCFGLVETVAISLMLLSPQVSFPGPEAFAVFFVFSVIFSGLVEWRTSAAEEFIVFLRKSIRYCNPVGAPIYLVICSGKGIAWAWRRRSAIMRAVNDGMAFLLHVLIATGVGLCFDSALAGAAVGFILGCADHFVYKKSHDLLLAVITKEE